MRVEVWRKVRKDFMIEVKALKTDWFRISVVERQSKLH